MRFRRITVTALAMGLAATAVGSVPAAATGPNTTYLVVAPQGHAVGQAADRVASAGGTIVASYPQIGVLVVQSTSLSFETDVAGSGVEAVASTASLRTRLDEEEVMETVDAPIGQATGNPAGEPLWGLQWNMPQINLEAAHAITTGSSNVVVGVLDTGISSSHPDLATQIDKSKSASCLGGVVDTNEAAWNPTTSTHGTHVAGTIAAALNGIGVAGVAPGVKVASVKVVTNAGFIYPEAAICGFIWAAENGMQITNNSYFIDPWEFNCRNDARQRPVWQAVQRAIRYSQSRGVLNIASAGNSNVDLQHKFIDDGSPNDGSAPVEERLINNACVVLPGEAPGVVTVSAVGRVRLKSYYSSYGQAVVDVAAPGGDTRQPNPAVSTTANAILSTTYNTATGINGYGYLQGTSMASPHAAGVAALALSAHPGLTPAALASFLERTSVALPCPPGVYDPRPGLDQFKATCTGGNRNGFYGAGEVDALAAVQ
ncbi:S8 family peptidase [Catelliglobosispora koreensis]|uniref:S8 family peptidase n=1 Tax=Catelliglobosispora koreensis TaxID=129052 RepID=UPI00058EF6C0|nr:S8 family serine peptidase [Catelliglobosispora koreensis]